eukprot:7268203-Lingulodinium_polyedra.AAC.1
MPFATMECPSELEGALREEVGAAMQNLFDAKVCYRESVGVGAWEVVGRNSTWAYPQDASFIIGRRARLTSAPPRRR